MKPLNTTHALLEAATELLEARDLNRAAWHVFEAKKVIPDVPLYGEAGNRELREALKAQSEATPVVWQCKRGMAVEYVYDADSAERAANPTGIGPYGPRNAWKVTPLYARPTTAENRELREATIEECARIVEGNVLLNVKAAHRIADAIRALKDKDKPL